MQPPMRSGRSSCRLPPTSEQPARHRHCGAGGLTSVWLVVLKSQGQALQGQLFGGVYSQMACCEAVKHTWAEAGNIACCRMHGCTCSLWKTACSRGWQLATGCKMPCAPRGHNNKSLTSSSHAFYCRTDSWVWCDDDGDEEAEASGPPARRIADALLSSG